MESALHKLESAIDQQKKKLAQLRARKQAIEARKRAAETKEKRAKDTRQKILLGSFVLAHANVVNITDLAIEGTAFADYLSRDDDRALFGLPPRAITTDVENPPSP